MALYVLSYDLIKDKNYQKLWDALEKQGAFKALASVYLISTSSSHKEVNDWIKSLIDDNDKFLLAVTTKAQLSYTANKGINEWLANVAYA